jgi:hypothetical protein
MTVDKLTLVELIERETTKLSPRGRELWERLELHVESAPNEVSTPPAQEEAVVYQMAELPGPEQGILARLMDLLGGLRNSDRAEKRGDPGEPHRNMAVIVAAGIKDRSEGRQIDPDMTPERAVARLREPG